ncbi:ABC transporter ATP-binding protein [Desulfocapsa sp. AH-315-G09]|nr:ABC transporter ATP-binding protein [Desulfocapsa sp. AH-315-G09]
MDLLGIPVSSRKYDEFWALRDIDISIPKGARIGLIGHNGAGKSTLLKIISGQISPTIGRSTVKGEIQALMELGTGFHPEFTGRENIFSSLAYQGITGAVALEKYHNILTFSELEDFIDNPVKTYSAGMYARLAFSAATAIQPEILIIDEILGAGDAYFGGKCVGRMKELTSGGTTVLFVSHDMSSVQQLCEKVIWIDRGRIRCSGSTLDISKKYLKNIRRREEERLSIINQKLLPDHSKRTSDPQNKAEKNLLFHFVVDDWKTPLQPHPINRLTISDTIEVIGKIDVGNAADNDLNCANHVIVQRNVMEWSDSETRDGKYCRSFSDVGGSYLHAPFQFRLSGVKELDTCLNVQIEYYDLGDEKFHVELFSGGQYRRIGTIIPQDSRCWKHVTFPLYEEEIKTIEHVNEEKSKTEPETDTETVQVNDEERYGSGEVKITSFTFYDSEHSKRNTLVSGEKAIAKMYIESKTPIIDPVAVIAIYRLDGICALQVISSLNGVSFGKVDGNSELTIVFDPLLLGAGDYIISIALFKEFDVLAASEPAAYDLHDRCYSLKVIPPEGINVDLGIVNQPVKWIFSNKIQADNE